MAFFGLAHVGPQSSFLASRKNAYTVSLFSLQEFQAAFERTAYAEHCTTLPLAALSRVLDAVFHGPPPALEAARLSAALAAAAGEEGALALEPFLDVIASLQAQPLEVDADAHAHYSSFDQLCVGCGSTGRVRPHCALRGPPNSFSRPLHPTTPNNCHGRRAHKLRQVRPFHGPEETQRAPATGLQDIGFLAREAKSEKRFVKNHCEETKFKGELLKAGIYY